jgi:hypothetical protein
LTAAALDNHPRQTRKYRVSETPAPGQNRSESATFLPRTPRVPKRRKTLVFKCFLGVSGRFPTTKNGPSSKRSSTRLMRLGGKRSLTIWCRVGPRVGYATPNGMLRTRTVRNWKTRVFVRNGIARRVGTLALNRSGNWKIAILSANRTGPRDPRKRWRHTEIRGPASRTAGLGRLWRAILRDPESRDFLHAGPVELANNSVTDGAVTSYGVAEMPTSGRWRWDRVGNAAERTSGRARSSAHNPRCAKAPSPLRTTAVRAESPAHLALRLYRSGRRLQNQKRTLCEA